MHECPKCHIRRTRQPLCCECVRIGKNKRNHNGGQGKQPASPPWVEGRIRLYELRAEEKRPLFSGKATAEEKVRLEQAKTEKECG